MRWEYVKFFEYTGNSLRKLRNKSKLLLVAKINAPKVHPNCKFLARK